MGEGEEHNSLGKVGGMDGGDSGREQEMWREDRRGDGRECSWLSEVGDTSKGGG